MKDFIQKIVESIGSEDLEGLKDACYVFPTRRACRAFQNRIQNHFSEEVFWAPTIYTIQEFIESFSKVNIPPELNLIQLMHECYLKIDERAGSLEEFYGWGKLMLKDFEEIDNYLIPAEHLFKGLRDTARIEQLFNSDEDIQTATAFNRFSEAVLSANTPLSTEFLRLWENAGTLYSSYNDELDKLNWAYRGKVNRMVSELISDVKIDYSKITFCGFNALLKSEENIFQYLFDLKIGHAIWDTDLFYMKSLKNFDLPFEAGRFLRRYRRKWNDGQNIWFESDMSQEAKRIEIIGTSRLVGQNRVVSSEAVKFDENPSGSLGVVLSDAALLLPLQYQLPELQSPANISLGYPISITPLADLLEQYFFLHEHAELGGQEKMFRSSDLLFLFQNGFVRHSIDMEIHEFISKLSGDAGDLISQSKIESTFSTNLPIRHLFGKKEDSIELLSGFLDFIREEFYRVHSEEKEDSGVRRIEKEYLYFFYREIVSLKESLKDKVLTIKLLRRLLRQVVKSLRVPFESERESGIQIGGLLETRLMDYDTVMLMSMNEGRIPPIKPIKSIFPALVRRGFGLPMAEDQSAIYAYHIYRLIQRAKRVILMYDDDPTSAGGEISRYVEQIKYYFGAGKSNWDIIHSQLEILEEPRNFGRKEIVAEKSELVLKAMREKWAKRGMSPSELITYVACPLQYYYRYGLGLRENEKQGESLKPNEFGTITHKALELAYEPFLGKELNKKDIEKLKKEEQIDSLIERALQAEDVQLNISLENLKGLDLVNLNVIRKLLKEVFDHDMKEAPLKILGLEAEDNEVHVDLGGGEKIKMAGSIDRVDSIKEGRKEVVRILDYKTGTVKMLKLKNIPANYLDRVFSDSELKGSLQTLLYTYFYWKSNPSVTEFKSGIFGLKKFSEPITYVMLGRSIEASFLEEFELALKTKLREIVNPDIPFMQVEDEEKCNYCPYQSVCHVNLPRKSW